MAKADIEDLLDAVWRAERDWKLDDRIAFALRKAQSEANRPSPPKEK